MITDTNQRLAWCLSRMEYRDNQGCLYDLILKQPVKRYRTDNGYIAINAGSSFGKPAMIEEHRVILALVSGKLPLPGEVVDHINRVKDDNAPSNLRYVSVNVNNFRSSKAQPSNKLGVRGITWEPRRHKFVVQTRLKGASFSCQFDNLLDARAFQLRELRKIDPQY